jgi:hypothetical protein
MDIIKSIINPLKNKTGEYGMKFAFEIVEAFVICPCSPKQQ